MQIPTQKIARMAKTLSLLSSFAIVGVSPTNLFRALSHFSISAMSSANESNNNNNQSVGLDIAFDRRSRTYHPGERVSGELIITSNGLSVVSQGSFQM